MKKLTYAITIFCLILFTAGSALAGASAKFAATWSIEPALASVIDTGDVEKDTVILVDSNDGYTLATIKVPQGKELLVGLSAEIGLVTFGAVKGKNGGAATAIADALAYVTIFAVPTGDYYPSQTPVIEAAPGKITLSNRVQTLDAKLGGVIQECKVACDADGCDDIVIAEDCEVSDEEISLMLETTAAHHFNFVLADMDQGEYDIVAVFHTGASAQVKICDEFDVCSYDAEGTVSASAYAEAVINKTMLTIQEVRAVKNTLEVITIE
jgi:hypothetical protein